MPFEVLGYELYSLKDEPDKKSTLSFISYYLFPETHKWASANVSYTESDIRKYVNETIYDSLPENVRSGIKEVVVRGGTMERQTENKVHLLNSDVFEADPKDRFREGSTKHEDWWLLDSWGSNGNATVVKISSNQLTTTSASKSVSRYFAVVFSF